MQVKFLSIAGFAAAVAALLWLARRDSLFGVGPISIGLQVAAFAFMVWARIVFGVRSFHAAANTTEGELVTNGPFAFVRNPIYAAVVVFTWTGVAAHFSAFNAALGCVVLLGMLVRIFFEEQMLRARYPEYTAYAQRVKRLVPFVF
jgi:protein-S-isoprenylcysteine O-methyltransferase Ste14